MNIIDFNKEKEINNLIHQLGCLIQHDHQLNERTFEYLGSEEMPKHSDGSTTVSVRFPNELLKWIDSYSRIVACNREIRTTRNSTIVGFLGLMRDIFELQSKEQWDGRSHIEEIKRIMTVAATKLDKGKTDGHQDEQELCHLWNASDHA